ncbi:MAG: hypothetical protein ABIF28_09570 [Pseudomonadota bacterium]
MTEVSHLSLGDVDEFFREYFPSAGQTLLIGNVGFSPDVLFFPSIVGGMAHVDMRFLYERRPGVPLAITRLAATRMSQLQAIAASTVDVRDVAILADDGAPVGGRNACSQVHVWLSEKAYTDVIVDATGMSRGTAFPIVKQLHQVSQQRALRIHLVVADSEHPPSSLHSVANDRADWMHGFAAPSETDDFVDALKLWVVQLSENSGAALQTMFAQLQTPDEVCPVLPFPSANPRRADRLLFELREYWQGEWLETPMSFIRAHESDPMDVYRSISRLHGARREALVGTPSLTILSPVGRRLPGIGMLLAALAYELPIFYLETVGYHLAGDLDLGVQDIPTYRWHFRVDQLPASPAR